MLYFCGHASSSLARTHALKFVAKLLDYEMNYAAEGFQRVFVGLGEN